MQRTLLLLAAAALTGLALAPAASARVIVGTAGDDTLAGTERRDFVYGRAGADTIAGNGGSDLLFGQRGGDTVSGDDGRDLLWGGPGNDTLEGGAGPDELDAGRGADSLEGGPGDDVLRARQNDRAPDVLGCGEGTDRAVIRAGDVAVDCERVRTLRARRHRIVFQRGTNGDDTLTGSEKRDFVLARAGDDTVSALAGSDLLFGQRGDDSLDGGDGRDYLWGGAGDDDLEGGAGPDSLWGGWGADELFGGDGNDRLHAAADDGAADLLDCGESDGDRDRAVLRTGDTAVGCERVRTLAD